MERNDFSSIDTRSDLSGNLSQPPVQQKFRESVHPVQPILPAFRVGVVITSVGYVERKHEERGKYSIEEERVKMRFVIARRSDASIEEMRFSFFSFFSFLTRENNSWFSFYGKIDEAEDFFDG